MGASEDGRGVSDHEARKAASATLTRCAAAVAVALLATACGGSSGASHAAASSPTLTSRQTRFGRILTNGAGDTLYMFAIDTPHKSNCPRGACTAVWPPLEVHGRPTVAGGVNPALVGEITRPSGAHQVTYAGWPLYTYSGDSGPGSTAGQALDQYGGYWYVITVQGRVVKTP
jgi:predicted lipoprotein with Yx(FWY)xxD motif